jgi:hypothetical protein
LLEPEVPFEAETEVPTLCRGTPACGAATDEDDGAALEELNEDDAECPPPCESSAPPCWCEEACGTPEPPGPALAIFRWPIFLLSCAPHQISGLSFLSFLTPRSPTFVFASCPAGVRNGNIFRADLRTGQLPNKIGHMSCFFCECTNFRSFDRESLK